jgi:general secretion pathway protein I
MMYRDPINFPGPGDAVGARVAARATAQRGFSLLEVLVAFAILSMTLGVLLQVFSVGLRNTAISEEYTYAVLHAESVLAALGREEPLLEGSGEGQLDDKFSWRSSVTPYEEEDVDLSDSTAVAYRLEVEVFWQSADKTRSIMLETLRVVAPD